MTYIVQPGDTLYNIAMQYNTTVSNLINLNPRIGNPNKIYSGERINVGNPWGFNPWWGNEWQIGRQEYQRGTKELQRGKKERQRGLEAYRRGRAEYRKGRKG